MVDEQALTDEKMVNKERVVIYARATAAEIPDKATNSLQDSRTPWLPPPFSAQTKGQPQ
jgi:hypothetical protein